MIWTKTLRAPLPIIGNPEHQATDGLSECVFSQTNPRRIASGCEWSISALPGAETVHQWWPMHSGYRSRTSPISDNFRVSLQKMANNMTRETTWNNFLKQMVGTSSFQLLSRQPWRWSSGDPERICWTLNQSWNQTQKSPISNNHTNHNTWVGLNWTHQDLSAVLSAKLANVG